MITIDTSHGAVLITALLIFVLLYLWTALALAALFGKIGQPAWQAWVPVLNQIVLLRLAGFSGWMYALVLIPLVGPLLLWGVLVAACHRISVLFGYGAGLTVVAALLLPLWASILGFGPARWLGAAGADAPRRVADPYGARRTPAPYGDEYVPLVAPVPYRPSAPPAEAFSAAEASGPPADASPARPVDVPAAVPAGPPLDEPAAVPAGDAGDEGTTDEPAAVAAPISAVPALPAPDPEPAPPMVTRLPAPAASARNDELWAPVRAPRRDDETIPEISAQVSAVVGAPDAGTPRSANGAVAAQHRQAEELPDELGDETVITRRRRIPWSLIPPSGAPVPIFADVVILGRRPVRDPEYPRAQLIGIDDGTVSKTHARLERRDDHWFVTDLGSTNGVLFATMMGTEVEATPGVEIEAGERFFLGDAEVRLARSDR